MKMFEQIDKVLILGLAIGFVFQELLGFSWMGSVLGLLALITIMVSLPKIHGPVKVLSMSFLAIGIAVMFFQKVLLQEWQEAATLNLGLVTLFVFAPMFGIPVRSPIYVSVLKKLYQLSIKGSKSFYLASQLLTQVLAVFLSVGSISIVYHLASIHPCSKHWRLICNALNRGFSGAIIWSPYFSAMILVTSTLNVSWTELLPYLLGFTIIYIVVSFIEEFIKYRKPEYREEVAVSLEEDREEYEQVEEVSLKRLIPLVTYLLLAMAIIIGLEQFFNTSMVMIISFAAIFYPMLWCLVNSSFSFYKKGIHHHIHIHLASLKKEIVLFISAGFLSGAIGQTNIGEWLPSILTIFPIPISIAFSIMTVLVIILTSSIGSHPIIIVTILVTTIDPLSVGITPIFFALLLLGSWSISNSISPASAVNNLLSNVVHRSVSSLIKINYTFSIILCVVLPVYLFLLGV